MFGNRFINEIKGGTGNVQVSGNVDKIIIGISFAEHLSELEKRLNKLKDEEDILRKTSENRFKEEVEKANIEISKRQNQIDSLTEILTDPQKYIEYSEGASIKLSEFLTELEAKKISLNLGSIKKEIEVGAFSNAESLIEQIEKTPGLSAAFEAEVVSARATLAFLDLQFDRAEALSRRAFYLSPSVNALVSLLEQMDMNGSRGQRLAALREAKNVLYNLSETGDSVRLLAIEAGITADGGELKDAKALIKKAKIEFDRATSYCKKVEIDLDLSIALIAILERDYKLAIRCFTKTLQKMRNDEDISSLFIIRLEANIGACLAEQGCISEAISITADCVDKLRAMGDGGKYHLGIRLNNLGDFLVRNNQAYEAIDILQESIALAVEVLPERHPSLIRRRLNLAIAKKLIGNINSSIIILKSIEADASMLGELDKRSLVKAQHYLFICCVESKNYYDALTSLLRIQEIGSQYLEKHEDRDTLSRSISTIRSLLISSSVDNSSFQSGYSSRFTHKF